MITELSGGINFALGLPVRKWFALRVEKTCQTRRQCFEAGLVSLKSSGVSPGFL